MSAMMKWTCLCLQGAAWQQLEILDRSSYGSLSKATSQLSHAPRFSGRPATVGERKLAQNLYDLAFLGM